MLLLHMKHVTNNTYLPGIPHSGSDVGFPAITDSDGGMNFSIGPSEGEMAVLLPLLF